MTLQDKLDWFIPVKFGNYAYLEIGIVQQICHQGDREIARLKKAVKRYKSKKSNRRAVKNVQGTGE
jgi:hypothetical protein